MASEDLLNFLHIVDDELVRHANPGEILNLHLLGRSALILGYGVQLMTKDVDVLYVHKSRLLDIAVEIFGKDGSGHIAHRFYLETVSSALPPLPSGYERRCVDIPGGWRIIRPKWPEANDLVVTKLTRFHPGDRADIQILCDTGDVDGVTLEERFDLAHSFSDRDDPKVVSALENLKTVLDYLDGRRQSI